MDSRTRLLQSLVLNYNLFIVGAQIIDMMLLVIDITKGMQTQTAECLVIGEITCNKMVVVLNKIDLIEPEKRKSAIEKVKLSGIRMLRIYKLIFKSNFSDEEESVHDFEEYQI